MIICPHCRRFREGDEANHVLLVMCAACRQAQYAAQHAGAQD